MHTNYHHRNFPLTKITFDDKLMLKNLENMNILTGKLLLEGEKTSKYRMVKFFKNRA